MTISEILETARAGSHPACRVCVWRPQPGLPTAFGVSCVGHGINWHLKAKAVTFQISQDPAGTTPATTGNLCGLCNSANPTDRSAQQGTQLWQAGVERDSDVGGGSKFWTRHYWTNAVMHGRSDGRLQAARSACTAVLRDQIVALAPRVIIGVGTVAAQSLNDIGFLKQSWPAFRQTLRRAPHCEHATLPNGDVVTVFVTYHASARSVNQTVAALYADDVENLLEQRLTLLPTAGEARRFLRHHSAATTPGRGMRVLLLHWLDIGAAIRAAHGLAA